MVSERNKHELSNGSPSATSNVYSIHIGSDEARQTANGISSIPTKDNVGPKDLSNHRNDASETANASQVDEDPLGIDKKNSQPVDENEPGLCSSFFSWRGAMYLLLHLSFIALNLPRSSINMAYVCINTKREEVLRMANMSLADIEEDGWSAAENNSKSTVNGNRSILEQYSHIMNDINWDSATVGLTLAGGLFLSCLGPILFDAVRQYIGSRYVIVITLITNTILMFTSPIMARTSPYLFLANRIVLGLTMGGNAPIVGAVLPRWTPEKQRLTATTIVYAGYNVGAILSSVANGFMCSIPIDNGWPFIFYISGVALLIYAVAWYYLMTDSPETHPFISEREKTYIQKTRSKALEDNKKKFTRPPYLAIAKSIPVLAYIFTFSCFLWTMSVSVLYVPIYLSIMLGFNAEMTGILFAVISCTRVLGAFVWTAVGNYLTNSGLLSQPATRKTCICVGLSCAAICCGAVSFFDRDDKWVAITLIMATMFLQSVATSHVGALPMELAPRYAGTLMSISMSLGFLVALTGPLAVASLTPTNSYSEWRVVWYMLSAIFLTAGLVFLIFGQAKIQPWAAMAPEIGETNKDIEQQSTDISMVPVVDFSESDKIQDFNGHLVFLEPGISEPDREESQGNVNHEITPKPMVPQAQLDAGKQNLPEHEDIESTFSSPNQSLYKQERSYGSSKGESLPNSSPEMEKDNLAFEADASIDSTNPRREINRPNPTSKTDSLPDTPSSKIEKTKPDSEHNPLQEVSQPKTERDNPAFEDLPPEISTSKVKINDLSSAMNVPIDQPDSKNTRQSPILATSITNLASREIPRDKVEQHKPTLQITETTKL